MKINAKVTKGLIFLLLALLIYLLIPSQIKLIGNDSINARSFPMVLVYIMSICSLLMIINGFIAKDEYWIIDKNAIKQVLEPIAMLLIIFLYVLLIPRIGFLLSSLLCCCGALAFLKCKKISYYVTVVIFAVAVFLIFTKVLYVPLP